MTDVHTPKQRSKNMSAIKGRGNATTELRLIKLFRNNKVKGWRRHYDKLLGKPDIVFLNKRIAVFTDGCFWHGCPKCYVKPESNKKFWINKVHRNRERDKKVNKELRKRDWKVLRIWEHKLLKSPDTVHERVIKFLKK